MYSMKTEKYVRILCITAYNMSYFLVSFVQWTNLIFFFVGYRLFYVQISFVSIMFVLDIGLMILDFQHSSAFDR